jgi:hypothetical protein
VNIQQLKLATLSLTRNAGKNAFCSGCQTIALADDFNLTHEDFLKHSESSIEDN